MVRSKIGQTLQQNVRENSSLYLFTIVLFIMGVGFGAVVVNSLGMTQKQELFMYVSQFFHELTNDDITDPLRSFQSSLGHYLKYIGFMWILGLSIIGLPLILIMVFLKGVVVGFTVGFLVNQLQWKGLYFAAVSVLPQNLLVIPAMIIVATAGISFSLHLIQSRFMKKGGALYPRFFVYSALILIMGVVMTVAAGFEAFVSPSLMKHASAMLLKFIIIII
ncbi:stage II sporulation protein M [Aneurinibacillus thermoaerophilus]|uniref:Stage II sporulation protein M n=1 Tax=Aneurinibacillus thermoaerophilus TaxID=143495 RepID=A0ABX8YDY5_ANETH|nr:stage II sporulation protein M [Aneurinibacillus thermoaerophilus]QYY43755.1 stage II sporulation protein M [Aneurinibacillus thermoaerophilus]